MKKLIGTYAVALLVCILFATVRSGSVPLGLSVTMGTTISSIYSTMLGSLTTTLSSSMIMVFEEPFRQALAINQALLPLVASIVLCFAELARSSYGRVSDRLELASQSLMSEAVLLTVLCLVFLSITFYYCVLGVFW